MLIAAIITGLISLTFGVLWACNVVPDECGDRNLIFPLLFFLVGIVWFVCFISSLNLQISNQELTGYIYSSSNKAGFTTAHIRFSQNAGTDAQPAFCVRTDSDAGRAIAKYAGSDTKVKVSIPSYFYFANNPFTCGTTNTIIAEVK